MAANPSLPRSPQCAAIHAELQAWLDGTATADSLDRVEAHASRCPACTRQLQATFQFRAAIQRSALPTAPKGLSQRIAATIQRESLLEPIKTHPAPAARWWSVVLAASVLLAVLVGLWRWQIVEEPGQKSLAQQPRPQAPDSLPQTGVTRLAAAPTLPSEQLTPVMSMEESLARAGHAMLSWTRRATRESLPSVGWWSDPSEPESPLGQLLAEDPLEPAIRELKKGAKTAIAPVTRSARKAVDLFLGDAPASIQP